MVALVLLVGFIVGAVASNPSEQDFKQYVKSEIRQEGGPLAALLLGPVGAEAIMAATKRTNLLVCSVYTTELEGRRQVRLAAFGHIWGPL